MYYIIYIYCHICSSGVQVPMVILSLRVCAYFVHSYTQHKLRDWCDNPGTKCLNDQTTSWFSLEGTWETRFWEYLEIELMVPDELISNFGCGTKDLLYGHTDGGSSCFVAQVYFGLWIPRLVPYHSEHCTGPFILRKDRDKEILLVPLSILI